MSYSSAKRKSDNPSRVNREAKSILAKLLAAEGIRVVHSATAVTATWSGATRTLTLPIWKEMSGDIYDMLCLHEVGHVKYTPAENSREVAVAVKAMTDGKKHLAESAFGFLNICEDTRIERLMKTRFSGAARSFARGYKWLTDTNTWKVPNVKSLKFIDRVNVQYKIGHAVTVPFSPEEQVLVDRLATVMTFSDMVEVATAMYRLAQEQKAKENKPPQQPQGEPEQGESGEKQEPQDNAPANTNIPDDPDEDGPKETGSTEDDTDDGEGADSTDGDGDSDGESSDGKSDRNKPEDKDESSDDEADGKSSDSDDDGADSDESGSKSDGADDGDEDEDGSDSGDGSDSDESDDADGDSDSDSGSDADDDCDCEGDDDKGEGANGDGEMGDDESDEDPADANAPGHEGGKGDENDSTPDTPETDAGLNEALANLVDRNAIERAYVNVPEAILGNVIQDHKELHKAFADEMTWQYEKASTKAVKDLASFEKDSKPVVNLMAKRFDLKKAADTHRRAMTAKTGRLNPDMLHAYKLTEDIFLRATVVPTGKNHGLVMFIDWSSSMDNIMSKTIKQTLNLAMFCRRVGIPFEVYGFSDADGRDTKKQVAKDGDFLLGRFTLHNWLSGRMSAREWKRAMIHMMMMVRYFAPRKARRRSYYSRSRPTFQIPHRFNLGGTPLDDAIVAAMTIVPKFQAANDVQIVNTIFLTDGCSSRSPIYNTADANFNPSAHLIVHDPVTKTDYDVADYDITNSGGASYWGSTQATAMLLAILRERTDSNVIGFYLMSNSGHYGHQNITNELQGATAEEIAVEVKRFETDKFAVAKSKGYSEYYLIDADQDAVTEALAGATAEALTKMSRSKRVNRVLLNRFVDMIAA